MQIAQEIHSPFGELPKITVLVSFKRLSLQSCKLWAFLLHFGRVRRAFQCWLVRKQERRCFEWVICKKTAKGVSSAHISRRMAIGFIRKSRDFSLSWLMTKMLPDANFRSAYRALLFFTRFLRETFSTPLSPPPQLSRLALGCGSSYQIRTSLYPQGGHLPHLPLRVLVR